MRVSLYEHYLSFQNGMEAQCLANQLQLFYGENNEKRNNLMRRFTRSPDEFKHMDLIAEIECLSF